MSNGQILEGCKLTIPHHVFFLFRFLLFIYFLETFFNELFGEHREIVNIPVMNHESFFPVVLKNCLKSIMQFLKVAGFNDGIELWNSWNIK